MKYKRYLLSELVTIKYGKNQKKVISEDGSIPIYGTGGLMGYATEGLLCITDTVTICDGQILQINSVGMPEPLRDGITRQWQKSKSRTTQ